MSWTPPPPRTTWAKRSWAAAARSVAAAWRRTVSWAADSASSASRVSAAARLCTRDTAASVARDTSSDTSSWLNGRRDRLEANRTPTNWSSTSSGTPQIATSPSSDTALSISAVCRNRSSAM